eukprot:5741253-Amphidinium_carterae.1
MRKERSDPALGEGSESSRYASQNLSRLVTCARNIPKAEASIDWWPRPDWELQQVFCTWSLVIVTYCVPLVKASLYAVTLLQCFVH